MAVVLATSLQSIDKDGTRKVVPEGTPFSKLTKAEKELAKELGLLQQEPEPEPDLDDEIEAEEEAEEAEAEDTES